MADAQKLTSKTLWAALFALLAFAANSVFCRLALGERSIDPASFTSIRLLSGAIILGLIIKMNSGEYIRSDNHSWLAATMLFIYATAFSFAYITLDTATGALILFGIVQLTMISINLLKGSRLNQYESLGAIIAFCGFVYLLIPNVSTPSLSGFLLMTIAGIAWGIYSLIGKNSCNPLADTAINFFRTLPLVVVLSGLFLMQGMDLSFKGALLAILSGAVASGMGYAVWYTALGGLSVAQAAVAQLLVPVIAALGGVLFASEVLSLRLLISMTIILGGIALLIMGRTVSTKSSSRKTV